MKHFIQSMLLGMLLIWTSCRQQPVYIQPPRPIQQVYQPNIQMGYQGSDYGAFITDSRGESYFLLYAMYNNLYAHGGYNSVTSYYYQHPNDHAFRVYNAGTFHPSRSTDAIAAQTRFKSSYQQAYSRHTVYAPTAAVVNKNVEIRRQTYGASYKPSPVNVAVAKPVVNTSVVTKPTNTPSINLTKSSPSMVKSAPVVSSRPAVVSRPTYSTPSRSYASPSRSSRH